MVADKWLLVFEILILVLLIRSIYGRIRRLNARIEEVMREEPSGPANPYQAMFDALDDAGGPGSLPKTPPRPPRSRKNSAP